LTPGETEKSTISINRNNVFWLAAAAVSLLIVSGIFLFRSVNPDPKGLYEAYYQPYPNVFDPAVRGDEKDTLSLLGKAFRQYEEGNYTKAAEYFKEGLITDNKIEKDIALLYLGNCYLAQNFDDEAKETLLQIDEQSHVADQGKWYLALAYLKLEHTDLAREKLKELSDHQNSYQDKAKELLQEIE
jgi:predicted Zn-dependent protease